MEKKLPLVHNERLWSRPWRWVKTAYFLLTMLASLLLVCAPPLLVVLLDLLLPPALLSNFLRSAAGGGGGGGGGHRYSFPSAVFDQAKAFAFRSSLVDLPAVSAARSLLILCAYTLCGGGGGYVWVVVTCSMGSVFYVLAKAAAVFGAAAARAGEAAAAPRLVMQGKGQVVAVEAMFLMSLALAGAHLAVAYRTSCRERRRLLVYRIDVEAGIIQTFLGYILLAFGKKEENETVCAVSEQKSSAVGAAVQPALPPLTSGPKLRDTDWCLMNWCLNFMGLVPLVRGSGFCLSVNKPQVRLKGAQTPKGLKQCSV